MTLGPPRFGQPHKIPAEFEDYRGERWRREGTRQIETAFDARTLHRTDRLHGAPDRCPGTATSQLRRTGIIELNLLLSLFALSHSQKQGRQAISSRALAKRVDEGGLAAAIRECLPQD
jgi:hypothetical protein